MSRGDLTEEGWKTIEPLLPDSDFRSFLQRPLKANLWDHNQVSFFSMRHNNRQLNKQGLEVHTLTYLWQRNYHHCRPTNPHAKSYPKRINNECWKRSKNLRYRYTNALRPSGINICSTHFG